MKKNLSLSINLLISRVGRCQRDSSGAKVREINRQEGGKKEIGAARVVNRHLRNLFCPSATLSKSFSVYFCVYLRQASADYNPAVTPAELRATFCAFQKKLNVICDAPYSNLKCIFFYKHELSFIFQEALLRLFGTLAQFVFAANRDCSTEL